MDFASLIGIISGITLVFSAIVIKGDIHNFLDLPSLMLVIGGTGAATLLTFRFKDVISAFKAAYFVFAEGSKDANDIVATMVKLCRISRREGIVKLGDTKTKSRFLKKACQLIADSSEEDLIRSALRTEIESLKMRHFIVQDVFKKMGIYSPAFGMLGTLVGLVQMLSKLQDASSLGPSMALALITTFYGSLLATVFFLPVAGKLKARTIREVINLEIIFEGAISILEGSSPTLVYERLSSHIPSRDRKSLRAMKTK